MSHLVTMDDTKTVRSTPMAFFCLCSLLLLTATSAARTVYQIAAILPDLNNSVYPWLFSIQRVAPAVDIAIENVQQNKNFTFDIRVKYADSKCDITLGMNEAFNFYSQHEVDVFFGPCCDYAAAPIARQVNYWNLPMLTTGAMAYDFGKNKMSLYPLLTRVGPTINSVAEFLTDLLKHFQWSHIKQVFDSTGQSTMVRLCHFVADGLHQELRNPDHNITEDHAKLYSSRVDYSSFLKNTVGLSDGIIVLCAAQDSVRELMINAAELNFTNGEYVFLNIDLFGSKARIERPWYHADDTVERNDKARKGYEALMIITLRTPDSAEYRSFSDKVKRRAKEQYGDWVYGEEDMNTFVASFHDAVFLYALALNETLAAGYNGTDGMEITKRMWGRSFQGITGTVSIDHNSGRNSDFSLLDLNPETGKFEVVANYFGNKKVYEAVPGKKIHWAGGRTEPPSAIPRCGFDNSGCPLPEPSPGEHGRQYGMVVIVLGVLLIEVPIIAVLIIKCHQLEREGWFSSILQRPVRRRGVNVSRPEIH